MSSFESYFILTMSFLFVAFLLLISFFISYKLGIKKALFRTTFILLGVAFSFALAPTFNKKLFNLNLSKLGITLTYKNQDFTTLVDYLEEVIVHSEFLNNIYKYFPSLKTIFMDFPEVLLAPVTYVLLFFLFIIFLLPLYLILSHRNRESIVYITNKTSHKVWAGILGCIQCIFIISVVLTPLNGINRIYHNAIDSSLDEEYDSICEENIVLNDYRMYCDLIDTYNSTIFAKLAGNESISKYVFNSLTKIHLDNGVTSIENEVTLVIKSGIVLDQAGLLSAAYSDGTIPLSFISENTLSDEDIDIIVDTLSNSKYSEDTLRELGDLISATLEKTLREFMDFEGLFTNYSLSKEELISEIRVVLKALNLLGGTTLLDDMIKVANRVYYFAEYFPEYKIDDIVIFDLMVDIATMANLRDFEKLCELLMESKIFARVIPFVLDKFLREAGFNFVPTRSDDKILYILHQFVEYGELLKKYKPVDFFDFMIKLNDEELVAFSQMFENVLSSNEGRYFIDFIFSKVFMEFDYYSLSELYAVKDLDKEVFVIRDFCAIMRKVRTGEKVKVEDFTKLLEYENSQFVKVLIKILYGNISYFIGVVIRGEKM